VRNNLAFALAVRRTDAVTIDRRVAELAELLEIGSLLDRFPLQLSGGEKQRVALGRALAFRPTTLCLDEPLSALDDQTRSQIIELLKRVQQETHVTTLHITHNRSEAETLADMVLELADGRINGNSSSSTP
jgi:ABC-type sulfate/molybdate transport systems ATPase subunit